MAWKKSIKNNIEFLVLQPEENYFIQKFGDIDYEITTQKMVELYPDNVFSELYVHGCQKILNWDMAQSLLKKIQTDYPELLDTYNKNKIVKSKQNCINL